MQGILEWLGRLLCWLSFHKYEGLGKNRLRDHYVVTCKYCGDKTLKRME
jgi:hypothetical protein